MAELTRAIQEAKEAINEGYPNNEIIEVSDTNRSVGTFYIDFILKSNGGKNVCRAEVATSNNLIFNGSKYAVKSLEIIEQSSNERSDSNTNIYQDDAQSCPECEESLKDNNNVNFCSHCGYEFGS